MEIKTKFNVGDEVFYMRDNRVQSGEVRGMEVYIHRSEANVIVYVSPGDSRGYTEDFLFGSKEELLKSL